MRKVVNFLLLLIIIVCCAALIKGEVAKKNSEKVYAVASELHNALEVEDVQISNLDDLTIGWISIDDSRIDYPLVQADDNDFYLTHNYLDEKDRYGAIYLDYRNDLKKEDHQILIYGHKMKDGLMFSDLNNYVLEGNHTYYETHNYINLTIDGNEGQWEVNSAYVVDLEKENYYLLPNYSTKEAQKAFIQETKRRTLIKSNKDIGQEEQVLTLVTCNFQSDNARTIIHATKVDK